MKFASKVYIIHRRDEFRASKVMQKRVLENEKAEVIWNTVVQDVVGDEQVEALRLHNRETAEDWDLSVRGMFVAIGHDPNTGFLRDSGLDLDENGYLKISRPFQTHTNIDGVFAAGDVVDTIYRQAVTAAGMGCKAAMDAERWLAEQED
jgi:thioredoxin reductase (NADPH)